MDATRTIRVATWNVHSCVGTDRRHDPARTAAVISELDADVVALQEFQYPADIALETRTPVVLERLDRYECALGPTLTRLTHSFGNVLLTRHPIRDLRRLDLSHQRREPRGALAATMDVHGVDLHVVATHLGLRPAERRLQVRRIMEHIETLSSGFLVVLGDFNDWLPGRSVVHVLDKRLGRPPRPASFPVSRPVLRLDRIWVSPLPALRRIARHTSAKARIASDHLPIVAEIDVDVLRTALPQAATAGRSLA